MITIRCSSLDRVLACAGSLEEIAEPYTPQNLEAREGTAGHEVLRYVARGAEPPVHEVAERYRVDVEVLLHILSRGRQSWAEVEQWFTGERLDEYQMEAELAPGVILRGTTDQMSRHFDAGVLKRMAVKDWKCGWQPSDHPYQVMGYAYLARAINGMPECGYILGVESHVRVGTYNVHKFTDAQLDAFRDDVLEAVRRKGKQFGPGPVACQYCPRQNACAARDDYLRSAVAPLANVTANQPITPAMIGEVYERAKMLGSAIERLKALTKSMLEAGVEIRLPDGRRLVIEDQEQDEIIPSLAEPFMRELAPTADELDLMVSVTKGGLEKVMKDRAPKGGGAAAMRAAMSKLRALGAVRKTVKRLLKAS